MRWLVSVNFNSLRYADDGRLIAVVNARQISMRAGATRAVLRQ